MNSANRTGRLSVAAAHGANQNHASLELDHDRKVSSPSQIIQRLGPQILSTLYMLVRNVRMYAPDNAIFIRPIELLVDAINSVVAAAGSFDLKADAKTLIINGASVKFDFAGLHSLEQLTRELEHHNVGGFSTERPINSQEIRAFLAVFTGGARGDERAGDHDLGALRLNPAARVRELLDSDEERIDLDGKIDKRKYIATVYARAVQVANEAIAIESSRAPSFPLAKLGRIMRTLVDFCFDQHEQLIGLTTCRHEGDHRPHHAVNTAILSMLLGQEAGLDKGLLHEIGMAGFLSQVARGSDHDIRGDGSIDPSPLWSARAVLHGAALDKTAARVILAVYESKLPYSVSGTALPGLGLFGKIIAIAECYAALTVLRRAPVVQTLRAMLTEHEHELDPALLLLFVRGLQRGAPRLRSV